MLKLIEYEFRKLRRRPLLILATLASILLPIPYTLYPIPVSFSGLAWAKMIVLLIVSVSYSIFAYIATVIGAALGGTASVRWYHNRLWEVR